MLAIACTEPSPYAQDDTSGSGTGDSGAGSGTTGDATSGGEGTGTSGDTGTSSATDTTSSTGPAPPSCDDDAHNGEETDVDCGGPDCDPCDDGAACEEAPDCTSGVCDGTCQAPTCDDGVLNGDEADADCGGACELCELIPFRDDWIEPNGRDHRQPDAAMWTDGRFVLTWADDDGAGDGDVMGRWFEADGDSASPAFSVHASGTANRHSPSVVLATGPADAPELDGAFVAYVDAPDVRYTRIDLAGSPVGTAEVVVPATPDDYDRPCVAYHDGALQISFWRRDTVGAFVRRFDATDGAPLDPMDVAPGPDAHAPDLAVDAGGTWGVAWHTCANVLECEVWLRPRDRSGQWLADPVQVNPITNGPQMEPRVAALGTGGFVVVWLGEDNDGDGVSFRTFDAAGTPTSDGEHIDDGIVDALAPLRDGSFVLLVRPDLDGDLSIRRFRGDGSPWGPTEQPGAMPAQGKDFALAATDERILVLWSAEVVAGDEVVVGQLFGY